VSGRLVVVAGGQYGSEGKGHVTDQLTRIGQAGPKVVGVRVAGPNAGHVVLGKCPTGCDHSDDVKVRNELLHRWKLRSIPVAAVSNPEAELIIAAGSEVDMFVLNQEVTELDSAGYRVSDRLDIDSQATLLTSLHIKREQESDLTERLGSTAKGIGASRADRLWRTAELFGDLGMTDTAGHLYRRLDEGWTIAIEGTQGFGLGLHAGNYPYCTSSDCRAIDFLSMAGLSPWHPAVRRLGVWLAVRVRPIRVAGNSGPLKSETSWGELGLPAERTTVTNKVRRVGEWDPSLVAAAVQANGGSMVCVALTMVDTLIPEVAGASRWDDLDAPEARQLSRYLGQIESQIGATVKFVGTGPDTGIFIQ
jgi:adenylosuccinate synthase